MLITTSYNRMLITTSYNRYHANICLSEVSTSFVITLSIIVLT